MLAKRLLAAQTYNTAAGGVGVITHVFNKFERLICVAAPKPAVALYRLG